MADGRPTTRSPPSTSSSCPTRCCRRAAAPTPSPRTSPPGARVLDCACGTGTLAVGLALRGHEVVATDASAAMVARTARARGRATAPASRRRSARGRSCPSAAGRSAFDVVFCVGNSLPHAVGRAGRRAALHAMAGACAPGGRLVVTSRTWEQVRADGLAAAGRRAARRARRPARAADLRLDDPRALGRAALLRRRGRARRPRRRGHGRTASASRSGRSPSRSCAKTCATRASSRRPAGVPADKRRALPRDGAARGAAPDDAGRRSARRLGSAAQPPLPRRRAGARSPAAARAGGG